MEPIRIALIGAGSRSFGPGTVRDIFLSPTLAERGVTLTLMDIAADNLTEIERYAHNLAARQERPAEIRSTTDLEGALDGAEFVVTAIEANRNLHWAQDYHIPRKHGFRQIYGENGGPGSLFHALRTMAPMVQIARSMERVCPDATLLNYTNPLHKVCEAVSRLTRTRVIGLCHGVWMGMHQISRILEKPIEEMEMAACGINHFTWFQTIRDRRTGEDLYPRLRDAEREGDWLSDWHEIGLSRILFRRFGLYPSPSTNHCGEYLGWADEFYANELHWFYDPADGHPWQTGVIPEFVYTLDGDPTRRPWRKPERQPSRLEDDRLVPSGELAIPIMESLACGKRQSLDAINLPNNGLIPNLPDDMVVEVPATADAAGLAPVRMQPLPEGIAAMIRLQGSIHTLLVEAFAEGSKAKLQQAVLLDPNVRSYRGAIEMVDEMLALQREALPPLQ
jgi:alpha-galactosidase/6-phospho-beta-glucosidase family protein